MKAKNFLTMFLAVVMVVVMMPVTEVEAAYTSGYYTYTVSGGEATITKADTNNSGSVTIPSSLGGYPVTKIGNSAFKDCTKITKLTIPENIEDIGNQAFENCTYVTELYYNPTAKLSFATASNSFVNIGKHTSGVTVYFGANVTAVPNNIFHTSSSEVHNIEKVIFHGDKVETIGEGAFYGCTTLKEISIPSNVTKIDREAFRGCTGLTSIIIPEKVTDIGFYAFRDCTYVTKLYYDPIAKLSFATASNSFVDIGKHTSGVTVYFGANVTAVPNNIFHTGSSEVHNIKKVIFHGDKVETIGEGAFYNCNTLETVVYPGSSSDFNNRVKVENYNTPFINALVYHTSHSYGEKTTITSPTCTSSGTYRHTCTFCDYVQTGKLSPLGHECYNWNILTEETCTTSGSKDGNCHRCGTYISETIPAHGHSFDGSDVWEIVTEEDCVTDGTYRRVCDYCGKVETKTVEKYGHSYSATVIKATCLENGYTTHTCSNCGDTYNDSFVPATGHSPLREASCTQTAFCANCGNEYGETDPNNHAETEIRDAVEATTTSEGYTGDTYCKDCGDKLSDGEVIPKLITPGDTDRNTKVNLADASLILKHIAKWDVSPDLDAADVTGDGKVNLADVSLILKYIAKWDVVLK